MNDLFTYDVDKDAIHILSGGAFSTKVSGNGPPPGFTHRATLDVELATIHVLLVSLVSAM